MLLALLGFFLLFEDFILHFLVLDTEFGCKKSGCALLSPQSADRTVVCASCGLSLGHGSEAPLLSI